MTTPKNPASQQIYLIDAIDGFFLEDEDEDDILEDIFGDLEEDQKYKTASALSTKKFWEASSMADPVKYRKAIKELTNKDVSGAFLNRAATEAVISGKKEILEILFEKEFQEKFLPNFNQEHMLALACSEGKKDIVEFLLSENLPRPTNTFVPNTLGRRSFSPLGFAVVGNHVDVVKVLAKKSAFNPCADGGRLLYFAARNHNSKMIELLSTLGCELANPRDIFLDLGRFANTEDVHSSHKIKETLKSLLDIKPLGFLAANVFIEAGHWTALAHTYEFLSEEERERVVEILKGQLPPRPENRTFYALWDKVTLTRHIGKASQEEVSKRPLKM